jgi:hypothetical protein
MSSIVLTLDELNATLKSTFSRSNFWLTEKSQHALLCEQDDSFLSVLMAEKKFEHFPRDGIDCERLYIPISAFHSRCKYQLAELRFSITCYLLHARALNRQGSHSALTMKTPGRWHRLWQSYPRLELQIHVRENKAITEIRESAQQIYPAQQAREAEWLILLNAEQEAQLLGILPAKKHRQSWWQRGLQYVRSAYVKTAT